MVEAWRQDRARAEQALAQLVEAGEQLEAAREVVVARARVAIAAGASPRDVAAAAGVAPVTLRVWLSQTTERVPTPEP